MLLSLFTSQIPSSLSAFLPIRINSVANSNSTTMKKLTTIFLIVFLLQASGTKAQITLDTTIYTKVAMGWDFKVVQLSETETKYYLTDTVANTFSLFNMDFTPFITNIIPPQAFGLHGDVYQALYISRTLFDCDSTNIEYLYEAPAFGGCASMVYVMRTDGTQLFSRDSARCPYCYGDCDGGQDLIMPIRNTSSGAKLFIDRLCTNSPEIVEIYSLCGTVPTEIFDFSNGNMNQSFVKVFPNPSSNSITFEIHPPSNLNDYELVIVNNNAKELMREKVNSRNDKYTFDASNFSNGTYLYSLCTKEKSYQSGKFIIKK
jgi:hypothetical protein